jgi:outer membrane protein OmpA-like peptidoglycan-associated protein
MLLRRPKSFFAIAVTALALLCEPAVALECSPGPFIILFDSADAYVDKEGMETLRYTRDIARECNARALLLEGHSDTREKAAIARKRIEVVRAYLVAHGIPDADISTKFYGSKRQRIVTGAGVSERQNRRVAIIFIPSF